MAKRLSKFVHRKSHPIFIKWPQGGNHPPPMNNSSLYKGLSRLWNKMFGSSKPISTTRLRKSNVTEIRRALSASRDVLARRMSHEPTTADKYYHLTDRTKMPTPLSMPISSVMECTTNSHVGRKKFCIYCICIYLFEFQKVAFFKNYGKA